MLIELKEWEEISLEITLTHSDTIALYTFAQETFYFDFNIQPNKKVIKAKGYVGQCVIKLPDYGEIIIIIHPKIELNYLMQWWCLANHIPSGDKQAIDLDKITDCIELLARWFTSLLIQHHLRGLLSAYKKTFSHLTSPKGQIDPLRTAQGILNGLITIPCTYENRTQDILENKVLLFTLELLKKHSFRTEETQNLVRKAYKSIQPLCTTTEISKHSFSQIEYSRINQHYKPLHTLALMIIESLSFSNKLGQIPCNAFMLPMDRIFEKAIANGLCNVLPKGLKIIPQEYHLLSKKPFTSCKMDIVIRDSQDNAIAVLDTKYKNGRSPSNTDIYQLVTYAELLNLNKAYLVYPTVSDSPLDCKINNTICCQSVEISMNQAPEDSIRECLMNIPELIFQLSN